MNGHQTNSQPGAAGTRTGKCHRLWPWLLAALAFAVSAGAGVWWIGAPEPNTKRIEFVGLCFTSLFGFLGLVFVIAQLREMARSSRDANDWNVRVESQKVISSHQDFHGHFKAIGKYRTENGPGDDHLDKLPRKLDGGLKDSVKVVANFFEMMASGIKYEIYDEEMLYDSMMGAVIDYYTCFEDYIRDRRKKPFLSFYCVEFEELAKRWKERYDTEQKRLRPTAQSRMLWKRAWRL